MVKLVKFRIKNYKSIKDTGDCYLANGITVLAGKNESGKTSILEALEDFDTDKKVRQEAVPIQDSSLKPLITLTFCISKEEFREIHEGIIIGEKEVEISITKDFENQYAIDNAATFFSKTLQKNEKRMKEFEKHTREVNKILTKHEIPITLIPLTIENFSEVSTQISSLKQKIEPHSAKLIEEEKTKIDETIAILKQIINEFQDPEDLEKEFLEEFKKYIPNFILFDTYQDQIPSKVPISQLKNDKFISDLAAISNLNIELIQDQSKQRENLKHKDKINIKLSEDYKRFWEQDAANLYLDWDKETLYFWIKDEDDYYEPKQRSKGRQWHLAFYVRVTARSREDVPNIILIDEPGLFLHAKAQRDILRKLEEASKDIEIIFSTHSPYLIDPNNLNRVRLVEKDSKNGTKINKVHAKADKETLTPILTAIGEDLSQGIRVDKKNSFVVEGISDYYYLHAFAKLLGFQKEFNLIPGCGDNIPAVASILFGWGLDPYFILDGDKHRLIDILKTKLGILEEVVLTVSEGKNTIEEIFSEGDFKKFVLEDDSADLSKGVLKYLKEKKLSKELLARKFIEKVNAGTIKKDALSQETVQNIESLFQKIERLLNGD